MIVDAELAQCQLDDADLHFLELELRTGGTINIRQLLRAVLELKRTREAVAKVQELEEELEEMREQFADVARNGL